MSRYDDLNARVIRALLWLAAFSFAAGIFLALTWLLRFLPPTPPVAVGRVTVERASKLADYVAALLFFIIIGPATIALARLGERQLDVFRRHEQRDLLSYLFVTPFLLAPFLYLTTFKWGWPLILPVAISQIAPRALMVYERTLWLRRLLRAEMQPFQALVAVEALAWVLFRYVGVGKRIAHVPTLFLEIFFVLFFVAVFWCALLLVARLATFTIGRDTDVAFQRLSVALLPMIALPAMAMAFLPGWIAVTIVMLLVLAVMAMALRGRTNVDRHAVRVAVAYAVVPLLLYCVSYASTASLTQWIDLFHRGESLGPASDYLRGKVPYRDVFVLHGLLDDGLLDAWLMQTFGRNVDIALARPVVLGSFAAPALWYLGMAIFDSMAMAALVVLLGAVTTVDNERVFFELAVLALLLAAIRRRSMLLVVLSGVVAGVTLFFSLDIGLYSVGGALVTLLVLRQWRSAMAFFAAVLAGTAPFVVYLAMRGALGAFLTTSFVTIPRIIDAVWSLPFPDLTTTFRKNLNLHTISDFFLFEHFRFVLNPLVIAIALVCLLRRAIARTWGTLEIALLALTAFAILTQRSALGRADFPHQYFSAFLIGPMIVILLVMLARAAGRLAVAALVPLLAVVLWVPDIANARLDDTIHYLGRVSGIGFVDPLAVEIRNRIDQVRYFVTQFSRPGQPIFDFSNQPALYFFCDRPNPTRFYQVPILSPPAFQRETILALERSRPPVVIRRSPQGFDVFDGIDNSIRAQAVSGYIDDYYSYAYSTRGLEVWRRRPATPRLNLEGYLRAIRLPSLQELGVLGTRARLIFPSVGTLPGANDAYWRSDLTLHNPFGERMSLAMRYVSGEVRAERALVLGAGQSIRWEDVTRSFLGAPEGRGVLWIEYHGNQPPVARVKTYDAAHNARPSIATPLSLRDAATAGGDNDELTIIGIPATTARRVNLGIVNIGQIPATFRISVHTRTGARVGRVVEEGIPEDESRVFTDAERDLGVTIDETMSVRVKVIAGTVIAYAAVVEENGDSELLAAVPARQP